MDSVASLVSWVAHVLGFVQLKKRSLFAHDTKSVFLEGGGVERDHQEETYQISNQFLGHFDHFLSSPYNKCNIRFQKKVLS